MSIKFKLIAVVLIVAASIFIGFYFIYQKYYFSPLTKNNSQLQIENPKKEVKNTAPASTSGFSAKGGAVLGWKLYKNSDFGFEIQYPVSWTVAEGINENVRGEMVKEFFFRSPKSDLHFAVLPHDGLSYSLPNNGASEDINIGGFPGVQTKYITADGRRLLIVHPRINMFNWDPEIGRLDIMSSALDPAGDFAIFNKMLNSFKFINL